jgi:hypothetical protein
MDDEGMEDPLTGYLRAKVICVFRNEDRILVGDALYPKKQELFYCLLVVALSSRSEVTSLRAGKSGKNSVLRLTD